MSDVPASQSIMPQHPTFAEATKVWGKIGILSFGGPAGQIALMHKELVDERKWVEEDRFLHALNFCMLLPGPEAQQLAAYIGWLLHGWRGGVVAGTLFVLPGFFVILGLSSVYALWHETGWLAGLFYGLKAAVLAIVIEALLRIGKRALKTGFMRAIAALSFLLIFFLHLPFPAIVALAALAGFIGMKLLPGQFPAAKKTTQPSQTLPEKAETEPGATAVAIRAILFWGGLWLIPGLAILALAPSGSAFGDIYVFFSKMAVVTFGGAYAVLAYVAQQAVDHYHWLKPGEMLDGLALAETTPGPLVLVLTFTGFMAAYRSPGALAPFAGGVLGAVLTTWVTFVPCFLWIFLGAPYVEKLRGNRALSGALAAISAAVAGVILNLAVWFALHVVFGKVDAFSWSWLTINWPDFSTLDPYALALSVLAALMIFRFHIGAITTLAVTGVLGYAISWLH
jgi:chromate transporter